MMNDFIPSQENENTLETTGIFEGGDEIAFREYSDLKREYYRKLNKALECYMHERFDLIRDFREEVENIKKALNERMDTGD